MEMQGQRHTGNSGSVFLLPDKGAVLIGGAEIDVDALDLVVRKNEELGIAEIFSALGQAIVGHKRYIALDEDSFDLVALDPVRVAPAALEVSDLVDPVIIRAGEAEIVGERVFDRR